jgi:hypothetical protein
MRSILSLILLLCASTGSQAADIDVRRLDNGTTLIVIDGKFELSDVESFRDKIAFLPAGKATVAFESKGGRLLSGIRIGSMIRDKKFSTVVADSGSCVAACALAWLGGAKRFVGQGARVGFQAAYILKSDVPTESGPGNAILGAYLNQLGLSERAILYVTRASPTSMQWLTMPDAEANGIAVSRLPAADTSQSYALASASERQDGNAQDDQPQQRALEFVRAIIDRWSGPSRDVLSRIEDLYADSVVYHGKSTPRREVLASKRGIAARWTERSYTIHPGSLSATCGKSGDACRVKGVMSWDNHNTRTAARSRGTTSFEYRVELAGEAPRIVAESNSVHDKARNAAGGPLKKMRKDLQQLLAQVSKLIQ